MSALPSVAQTRKRLELRAKPLLSTIYGDILLGRGGRAWMGSLIKAGEALGMTPRTVRTGMQRLRADGVLKAVRIGRRSDYLLTERGRNLFAEAAERIYGGGHRPDARWQLVLASGLDTAQRRQLWQELSWHGFGYLGSHVLLGPISPEELDKTCAELGFKCGQVVVIDVGMGDQRGFIELVRRHWKLDLIGRMYTDFLDVFRPLQSAVERRRAPAAPQACFALRVLLVNAYRRILIKDPGLPAALLPNDWQGAQARELCGEVYAALADKSEQYVDTVFETVAGPLPASSIDLRARFAAVPVPAHAKRLAAVR